MVFLFAVLKPLVEMTTIHYKPFENSPHKCHPLSAVSTPCTQGIFKKPNLRLSEILLNSYLFAAGSFLCNPIVMHWSWNQSPAVHATSVRFQTVAEHNNSIDSWINQRGKILRRKIHHAPWSSRGDQRKLGFRIRCGYELRESQQRMEARLKHRMSGDYWWINREEEKALKLWVFFMRWEFSTTDSSEVQRQCERSEPWRAPRPQQQAPYISHH